MVNFACLAFFPAAAIAKAGFAYFAVKKVAGRILFQVIIQNDIKIG
jgi:hypothetical protein